MAVQATMDQAADARALEHVRDYVGSNIDMIGDALLDPDFAAFHLGIEIESRDDLIVLEADLKTLARLVEITYSGGSPVAQVWRIASDVVRDALWKLPAHAWRVRDALNEALDAPDTDGSKRRTKLTVARGRG